MSIIIANDSENNSSQMDIEIVSTKFSRNFLEVVVTYKWHTNKKNKVTTGTDNIRLTVNSKYGCINQWNYTEYPELTGKENRDWMTHRKCYWQSVTLVQPCVTETSHIYKYMNLNFLGHNYFAKETVNI